MNKQMVIINYALMACIVAITTTLQSCADTPYATYPATKSTVVHTSNINTDGNRVLLNAYSYQQTTSYTCGPAVIMSLLQHYGKLSLADMNRKTEMQLAAEMGTTSAGTSQTSMVDWLQKHGFSVQYGQDVSIDMLLENLRRHVPTIIIWNDWSGHALMVIGYYQQGSTTDNDKDLLFFVDPSSSSNIVTNNQTLYGINSISPNQLTFNEFNARYFFNPSHTAVGMYIVATPN